MTTALGTLLTTLGLLGAIIADRHDSKNLRGVFKTVASAGFCVVAFGPLLDGAYANALHTALALSLIGDVLLIGRDKKLFLAGMVAFASAHIGYTVFFGGMIVDAATAESSAIYISLAMLGVMMLAGHRVWKRLEPRVGSLRVPVRVYVLVITLMCASALAVAATAALGAAPTLRFPLALAPLGAVLFCISDVAVARDRFIKASIADRTWGLAVYYAAQLLFAYSIAL